MSTTNSSYGAINEQVPSSSEDKPQIPHSCCSNLCTTIMTWFSLISVEPTMFLYMIAFMLTSVVEQAFYVHKACTVNYGYSEDICNNLNLPNMTNISNQVQVTVSNFHQWNGIAGHSFPIILAFFLGAWSDKRGRKVLILIGLLGKIWWSFMIVINSAQPTWPLEYVIYTATLPSAITGADIAIFAGAFAYISDITTPADRTLRIGILDVIYLSTFPIGVYVGSVLYTLFNKSYKIMFSLNVACLILSFLYTLIKLKWQTNPIQKSLREAGVCNPLKDFLDLEHVKQSIKTLFKKRSGNRRTFVWLLLLGMALYTFQRDEKPMLYLYTIKKFGWDVSSFSVFKTYYSTFFVFMMLLGIPIMSKVLKWKDTVIVMVGAASHAAGRIFYVNANGILLMYLGATAASLGPCVAPVIRSMASKAVEPSEKGKVYAILSVCDNAVTFFSATLYTQLYNATISTSYPYAIFLLTMVTQIVVLLFGLIIHLMLRGEPMDKYYNIDLTLECKNPLHETPDDKQLHNNVQIMHLSSSINR